MQIYQPRPEWQKLIIGWQIFVESRPELHLKANRNASGWFVKKHKDAMVKKGVMRRINKSWMVNTSTFPEAAFDALLGR